MPRLWNHWLQTCLETHTTCRSFDTCRTFVPKRLIEIQAPDTSQGAPTWRLVFPDISNPVDYVTLSHCWGSQQPVKLTDTNLLAFSSTSPVSILPKTYREALDIALSIGYQHIWIDSLCIIQDNENDWLEQSPQMALVYGNARCNIAATWASNGTEGCFSSRDPFAIVETNIKSSQSTGYYIMLPHACDDDILVAPLNKRGWVVQERCLALRQLSFTKRQVYWECAEAFVSEQLPNGIPKGTFEDEEVMVRPPVTSKPRLNFSVEDQNREAWCSLVENYSWCNLTRPSDKMIALASLVKSLRDRTGDLYLAGLWKKDLHRQLCWDPGNVLDSVTRLRPSTYHAPSWSWPSLDSPISTDRDYFGCYPYESVSLMDILSVTVVSSDLDGLHSFTSGELQVRAIAVSATFTRVGEVKHHLREYVASVHYPKTRAEGPGSSEVQAADIRIFWDEHVPLGKRVVEQQVWQRIQQQRSSEALLLLVKVNNDGEYCMTGLVLLGLDAQDETQERKFVRLGTFTDEIWFHAALCEKLGFLPGEKISYRLDLENVQLADLVQVVTIV